MDIKEALKIVLDLARANLADDPATSKKQQEAIAEVEKQAQKAQG